MKKTEKEPARPEITVAESFKKKHWSGLFDLIDVNGDGALSWNFSMTKELRIALI